MEKISKKLRESLLDDLLSRSTLFATAIAPVYRALGWTWGGSESDKTPTVDEIESHVEETIQSLKDGDYEYSESGGLKIELVYEDEMWQANLMFKFETTAYEKK